MFRMCHLSVPFFFGVFGLAGGSPSLSTKVLVEAFAGPEPKKVVVQN